MQQSVPRSERAHDVDRVLAVLADVLAYARERDYTGWDYADGMSSRLLRAVPVENRWLNLAVQETIKRSPVNVRRLALVEQRRNYKGAALFAVANLTAADLLGDRASPRAGGTARSNGVDYRAEAASLATWLVENRCEGYSGYCGSHRHEIQELDGRRHPSDADVVSTSYGVRALLAASELDRRYAAVARSAAAFVHEDLDYTECEAGARINYATCDGDEHFTHNAIALGARLLLDLHVATGARTYRRDAERLLDYVVAHQTDRGGWMYREPPSASHLSMDNHHNGFIVEVLHYHEELTDAGRYADALSNAMTFYRETLFEDSGAPNWDESNAYPRDVHAAAQGIIVFSYAGDLSFASRIVDWTLSNLYAGDGRFYFRQHRWFTRPIVLMRWCEAWMAYALSQYAARAESDVARHVFLP
jgi:hypothetical protein